MKFLRFLSDTIIYNLNRRLYIYILIIVSKTKFHNDFNIYYLLHRF